AFGCLLCFPSGAMRTTGKQCGLAATGVYQPSLRSPWLAAIAGGPCCLRAVLPAWRCWPGSSISRSPSARSMWRG
ncbi:hypothetical protein, partial [Thiolapillus sp.]